MNIEWSENSGFFFGLIFICSLLFTEIVRRLSIRYNFISVPASTRWSQRVVALGGGIAAHSALFIGILLVGGDLLYSIFPGLILVFVMGVVDDLKGIPPIAKLIVQAVASVFVVSIGYRFELFSPVLSMAVSVIWIVGMTNALNLIDNIDGLAAGFSVIGALGFFYLFMRSGQVSLALVALAMAAAAAGFLVHNFHPARIFMGDAGSLPFGFLLATLSTKLGFISDVPESLAIVPAIFLLIVPLFDMGLVIVSRRNAKRPVMSGGRDHSSHRLVALGMSERRAVLILYLMGGLGVMAAKYITESSLFVVSTISVSLGVVITLLGIFLIETVVVYPTANKDVQKGDRVGLPVTFLYIIELAIDICTVSLAWAVAFLIRFSDTGAGVAEWYGEWSLVPTLPFVIICKIVACALFRLYRGMWQTILGYDVYRIFKAALLGSLFLVVVLAFTTRLQDLSRTVVLLDGLLTFIGLLGTRAAISGFRRWSRRLAATPYKAALLGSVSLAEAVKEAVSHEKRMSFAGVIVMKNDEKSEREDVLGIEADVGSIVEKNGIDILFVTPDKVKKVLWLAAKGISIRPLRFQLG